MDGRRATGDDGSPAGRTVPRLRNEPHVLPLIPNNAHVRTVMYKDPDETFCSLIVPAGGNFTCH